MTGLLIAAGIILFIVALCTDSTLLLLVFLVAIAIGVIKLIASDAKDTTSSAHWAREQAKAAHQMELDRKNPNGISASLGGKYLHQQRYAEASAELEKAVIKESLSNKK